jgi:hypothetical protein
VSGMQNKKHEKGENPEEQNNQDKYNCKQGS